MGKSNDFNSEAIPKKVSTIIMKCNCTSEYQDKYYGNGNRIFNTMIKEGRILGYRCTVCGRENKSS